MRSFWPQVVYVASDAAQDDITKRVLSRLPDVEVIEVDDPIDPLHKSCADRAQGLSDSDAFTLGKRSLLLRRHLGSWLEHCPGTRQHVCCNLWTVNPGEGCPLDCTYCYLQSYLRRNPSMKIFTNTGEMLKEIEATTSKSTDRKFRFCTGEIMDSLVWDELTDSSFELVPFFARLPNAVLELKSKLASVDNLLALKDEHKGKTVVSWSVNAHQVTSNDEAFTSSLAERIEAACRVVEVGYRVGFHFDPLIYFDGFEDEYRDTIREIFSRIHYKDVAWVSIAPLRYKREMQDIMIERFPNSKIPFGEQFLASDAKLRYIQPLRFRMLNFMWKELKGVSSELPVYMCMESSAAWRNVVGGNPSSRQELEEVFAATGNSKLPVVGSTAVCS